jgi:hypothetical protein
MEERKGKNKKERKMILSNDFACKESQFKMSSVINREYRLYNHKSSHKTTFGETRIWLACSRRLIPSDANSFHFP